ncbi:translation initiation factor IF-2-like [Mirounga leonina]|uniref:translation initiation factor IF-2-like n=1 Tax=Mirounga leonina TaxID=9715 RepID=UPI00156C0657|nr:translation initiation factor IF-2-like [Mirounga leonina]
MRETYRPLLDGVAAETKALEDERLHRANFCLGPAYNSPQATGPEGGGPTSGSWKRITQLNAAQRKSSRRLEWQQRETVKDRSKSQSVESRGGLHSPSHLHAPEPGNLGAARGQFAQRSPGHGSGQAPYEWQVSRRPVAGPGPVLRRPPPRRDSAQARDPPTRQDSAPTPPRPRRPTRPQGVPPAPRGARPAADRPRSGGAQEPRGRRPPRPAPQGAYFPRAASRPRRARLGPAAPRLPLGLSRGLARPPGSRARRAAAAPPPREREEETRRPGAASRQETTPAAPPPRRGRSRSSGRHRRALPPETHSSLAASAAREARRRRRRRRRRPEDRGLDKGVGRERGPGSRGGRGVGPGRAFAVPQFPFAPREGGVGVSTSAPHGPGELYCPPARGAWMGRREPGAGLLFGLTFYFPRATPRRPFCPGLSRQLLQSQITGNTGERRTIELTPQESIEKPRTWDTLQD